MKILVVDDDQHFCEFMARILGELSECTITFAHDGAQAEELIAAQEFNLICLDLKLPRRDGNEVLKFIRARDAALPVLVLSGIQKADGFAHSDPYTRFAEKPLDLAELRNILRSQLDSLAPRKPSNFDTRQ